MLNSYDDVVAMRRMVADHYAKERFERVRRVDEARRRRESRRQVSASPAEGGGRG